MMSNHQVIHRTKQHELFLAGVWGLYLDSANWKCFCFWPCLAARPLLTSSYAPAWVFLRLQSSRKNSASSWPLHEENISFRKCWPALLCHSFQGLQDHTCSSMFFSVGCRGMSTLVSRAPPLLVLIVLWLLSSCPAPHAVWHFAL